MALTRARDVLLAILLLPPLAVVMAGFSVLIIAFDRMAPFYIQQRVGKKGRLFKCAKLQTLKPPKSEAEVNDKQRDEIRLTNLGRWLRNRGLDELPQVWNVLLGHMSFVGPRPLLRKNLDQINHLNLGMKERLDEWERARESVRPGLSGWHQIHSLGPGIVEYDMAYIQNPSWQKQIRIFLISTLIMLIGKQRYFG